MQSGPHLVKSIVLSAYAVACENPRHTYPRTATRNSPFLARNICLDPGSDRKTPEIRHGAAVNPGVFILETQYGACPICVLCFRDWRDVIFYA